MASNVTISMVRVQTQILFAKCTFGNLQCFSCFSMLNVRLLFKSINHQWLLALPSQSIDQLSDQREWGIWVLVSMRDLMPQEVIRSFAWWEVKRSQILHKVKYWKCTYSFMCVVPIYCYSHLWINHVHRPRACNVLNMDTFLISYMYSGHQQFRLRISVHGFESFSGCLVYEI